MENPALFLNTVTMPWWRNRVRNLPLYKSGMEEPLGNICPSVNKIMYVLAELQYSSSVSFFSKFSSLLLRLADGCKWC